MSGFSCVLRLFCFFTCLFVSTWCTAQVWHADYSFRKKITINKAKVVNVPFYKYINFPLLVQVEDPALIYKEDVFDQKLNSSLGLDITFTEVTAPKVPLKFQLESYDPVKGKIVCWVIIPILWSKGGSQVNELYLYYGSQLLHDPQHPDVKSMWQTDHHTVQHFNESSPGKIHTAKVFNGVSDQLELEAYQDDEFTFSAWIKLNNLGKEQMLVTNDSLGFGGYQLKINSDNKLMLIIPKGGQLKSLIGFSVMKADEWYHISFSVKNGVVLIFMNGNTQTSSGVENYTPFSPGRLRIGASKQGDRYFDGTIDELSIRKTGQGKEWMITLYENQLNPGSFYTVGSEEVNAATSLIFIFKGDSRNSLWTTPGNWSTSIVPKKENNIKILAGVVAEINVKVEVNKLLLEQGAKLLLNGDLKVVNNLILEQGASISSLITAALELPGYVLNHGSIALTGQDSKLLMAGNQSLTRFEGNGTAITALLEINQQLPNSMVSLQSMLQVKKSVKIIKGTLAANDNLWLLADSLATAGVYPLGAEANISGKVKVQNFVSTFQAPATGRGWRLLSAPVVYGPPSNISLSPFQDVQKSIFVTGAAGNGFDESPRNGATLYTHDQSLPGSVAQKYVSISNIQMSLPTGKGFFAYSRGSRWAPGAYQHQVQNAPFSNATSYVITYTGSLFKGDLDVDVFNTQKGEEGDGFNLLGNPYAAPIRWGSLHKINVGPYVWLFDPLNNTYRASMDPNEIIPAGAGFFIKVESNFNRGSIGFKEASKVLSL